MFKKVRMTEEDWDYLVILDACRYDYFCKLHREYFRGQQLEKVISPGSTTLEWCKNSFQRKYDDIVYISANPIINSKIEVKGFNAKDYFYKVVDVWSYGWNEELGTVHPEKVNQAVLNLINTSLCSRKKCIIHYLQPHAPYIGQSLCTRGFPQPQICDGRILTGIAEGCHGKRTGVAEKILTKIAPILDKGAGFLVGNLSWRIRELLNLPPASPMDAVRRLAGRQALREAYLGNLRLVLEYVKALLENLSGNIVITADHGELLGERGRYSHFARSSDPVLVEIPWLGIKKYSCEGIQRKIDQEKEKSEAEFEAEIKQRIKSLGYL